ncbi:MmgE/PrpD family protein [Chitinasiproducens palmae]|uniref:2-methylcitrate dehydratase PrpD n=1 Tax=Chitinasiproducens palmae TaxID=1770053 RepID=A0A1H2PL25_9BURK|nr:MmgE/PrpD family protein [Chitinasiproducens palmae]SDV47174.1 2-methylcitrate dehydratase PrpD [Chitinasiproducens palmae]
MNITQSLARFALSTRYDALPPAVIRSAKLLLLDTVGCALGAIQTEPGRAVRRIVDATCRGGVATVIGTGQKTSVMSAAWANGRLGNVLDMDECYKVQGHHAQASLGAALALGEQARLSGADLLVAFTMGFEVGVRLGNFLSPRVTLDEHGRTRGWSGLVGPAQGVTAACTAAAIVLGQSEVVLADAFGNCAQYMVGRDWSRQWGRDPVLGMIKYADTGWNAQGGMMAALHAQEGIRGVRDIFDGDSYAQVFQGALLAPEAMLDGLGTAWYLPETSIKFWPCCRWIHYALTAFDRLRREHRLRADEIEAVELLTFPMIPYPRFGMNDDPPNLVAATFSFAHAAAMVALEVPAGAAWFDTVNLSGEAARNMRAKITLGVDARGYDPHAWGLHEKVLKVPSHCRVKARGQRFEAATDFALGDSWHGAPPFSADDVLAKFRTLAASACPESDAWANRVDTLADAVMHVDEVDDVRELTALMAPTV